MVFSTVILLRGSFCAELLKHFIEGLLEQMQPFPAQNSVIVLDNCQIHKHLDIQQMIEERLVFSFICCHLGLH